MIGFFGSSRFQVIRIVRLMMTGQARKKTECHQKERPAAADDHRQQDGKHGAADIGFMRTCQADAFHNQSPNAGNEAPAKRDDE